MNDPPRSHSVSHFYCRNCDRSGNYPTKSAAKSDGWRDLHAEGSAGAMAGVEYTGLCPDCAKKGRGEDAVSGA